MSNLRQSIYTGLTAVTTNSFYQYFPNTFDYKQFGLVFFLRNASNENAFDKKEFAKNYQLEIIGQAPLLSTIEAKVEQIKNTVYGLEGTSFNYCSLVEQDDDFDDVLKVWAISLVFDITV